jgi:hypothetical protein
VFSTAGSTSKRQQAAAADPQRQLFVLAAMLLQPTLVLTDHGHFQYNCISLGLSALAAIVIIRGNDILGSILFSLSLNHKQMGLFFAPAFFAHLLGKCLQQPTAARKVGQGVIVQQLSLSGVRIAVGVPHQFIACVLQMSLMQKHPLLQCVRVVCLHTLAVHPAKLHATPVSWWPVCLHTARCLLSMH